MGRFLQAVCILRYALIVVVGTLGDSAALVRADDFQTLYSFTGGVDGTTPNGHLLDVGGTLYGTTQAGGSSSYGAIFAIGTDGSHFHSVYSFGALPGYQPISGLVAVGSKLFGTTYYDVPYAHGNGTVFSVNVDGSKFQNLHDFNNDTTTGLGNPDSSLAVVGGDLYGRTQLPYDLNREGAVYSLGLDGSNYQALYKFSSGQDAAADIAALGPTVYAAINDYMIVGSQMYGVIPIGVNLSYGAIFSMNLDGSNEHILYSFTGDGPDGAGPMTGLTMVGNRLYGTSSYGGPVYEYGDIFSLNLDGSGFRVEHSFVDSDGARPTGGLTLIGDTLYGTTSAGGIDDAGTIFSLAVPASQAPEPATWVLAVSGLIVIVFIKRSRRRCPSSPSTARHAARYAVIGICMASSGAPLARAVSLQAGDIVAFDSGTNTLYEIDPITGVRTIVANSTVGTGVPLGQYITGMTVDAAGDIFLASNADGRTDGTILRVDPVTGNRTAFSPLDRLGATLAISNDGKLLAAEWNSLLFGGSDTLIAEIDPSSGATLSSVTTPGEMVNSIAQSPSGAYYTVNGISNGFFTSVDPSTGATTYLRFPAGWQATSLTFDQSGSVFFTDGFYAIHRLDLTTGTDTVISGPNGKGATIGLGPQLEGGANSEGNGINSITFAPDGSLIVAGYNGTPSVFRIDPVTGDRTIVSQVFGGFGGSFYTAVVPSVPEPSTLSLALLAAAGLVIIGCRTRKVSACAALGVLFSLAVVLPADAQIDDLRTGQPIPGTAGVTPGPGVDLSNWNTSGHSLQYANFGNGGAGGFDLTGAVFDGSWLDNASFYKAIVPQASFVDTSLTGADFSFANATNANFANANLSGAALDYATLSGANLRGATITGANLQSSNISGQQLAQTTNYQNHSLAGVNLGSVNLSGADLSGQDFTGGSLASANLAAANLAGANLTNTAIVGADLSNTHISAAQLYETSSYKGGYLQGVRFSGDNLTDWSLNGKNLTGADFSGATVSGVDFSNSTINGANLSNSSITLAQIATTTSYQQKNLSGVNLQNANLTSVDLDGFNLSGTTFRGATLVGANLVEVHQQNSDFTGAKLMQANLSSSDFTNSNFSGADLTGANGAGSIFVNASMAGSILNQGTFYSDSFQGADLTGANLGDADLRGATFTGASVTSANFTGARLSNANFTGVVGLAAGQISSADKDLSFINLGGINLAGATLAGADLTSAKLTGANLAGANFAGATIAGSLAPVAGYQYRYQSDLTGVTGFSPQQLYATASYQSHNLTLITFANDNFSGWSFAGQNLQGTQFTGSTLTGADFTGATVANTDFSGTNLTSAQLYVTGSYQQQNLSGLGLANQNLSNWNFANQNLTGANLSGTALTGANFQEATIKQGNFANAGLSLQQLQSTASYQTRDLLLPARRLNRGYR